MKLNKILYITLFASAFMLIGCGGSGGDDGTPPPTGGGGNDDNPVVPDPSAATLVFPENNTECNTGIVDSNNASLSTVTFQWNASQNTDSYTVTITNLNTNNSSFTNSNTNEADITIERGTPYSWFVTSRASGTASTADSGTFRFYNEGPGIENYAPFPAVAVAPARGSAVAASNGTISLEWTASDIDDDLDSFEIVFGTDANNLESQGSTQENTIEVNVSTGTIYFWQVISTDSASNSSNSEIFEFRVL